MYIEDRSEYMKKKGFTLIELLAVIVILAVIALIATPLIMNVINDARKNSFKDSAYGITKAIELKSMRARLDDTGNSTFVVDLTGTDLDFKGSKPKKGYAAINVSGDIALEMNDGTWCVTKGFTDTDVTITKLEEGCDGSSIQSLDLSTPTSNDQVQGPVTGTIYSTSSTGLETGESISGKWCVVGTIEGQEFNSCDFDNSFSTETECQGYIQEGIDGGFIQDGDMTCKKSDYSLAYQKNASALNSDYYFKYDVNNDIIETSYLCYMADKEYCFDDSGSYADGIQVLQSLEPWINEHSGTCEIDANANSSRCRLGNIEFQINIDDNQKLNFLIREYDLDSCNNKPPAGCMGCDYGYTLFAIKNHVSAIVSRDSNFYC